MNFETIYEKYLENTELERNNPDMQFIDKMKLWNVTPENLNDIEFIGENINYTTLKNGSMHCSSFFQSKLNNSVFKNMDFSNAKFIDSTLRNCFFTNCDFSGAEFNKTNLQRVSFIACKGVQNLTFKNSTDTLSDFTIDLVTTNPFFNIKNKSMINHPLNRRAMLERSLQKTLNENVVRESSPNYSPTFGKVVERPNEVMVVVEIDKPFHTASESRKITRKIKVRVSDVEKRSQVNDIVEVVRKEGFRGRGWKLVDVLAKQENL